MASDARAALLRDRREDHSLSRAQLAFRVAVAEQVLSAHEDGQAPLSRDELRRYLLALGEELVEDNRVIGARPIEHRYDAAQIAALISLPPAERLARALAWDDFATNLSCAHEQQAA